MGEPATQQDEELELETPAEELEDGDQPSDDDSDQNVVVLDGEEEPSEPGDDDDDGEGDGDGVDADGEQQRRGKKRPHIRTLRQRNKELNRQNRAQDTELAAARAEIATLTETVQQLQARLEAGAPTPSGATEGADWPKMEDYGYDTEKYQAAVTQYASTLVDNAVNSGFEKRETEAEKAERLVQQEAKITNYYKSAAELNLPKFEEAEDKVVDKFGVDLVQSIQTGIPDAAKIIYYLGQNPKQLALFAAKFKESPGVATYELGVLSTKLSLKPKSKQPPMPDTPLKGGGAGNENSSTYRRFASELDKAYDSGDMAKVREVRKEAKQAGIDLPFSSE